jgi:hypothetical protein
MGGISKAVDIKDEQEVWNLHTSFVAAYESTVLPEEPNKVEFDDYLVKYRILKLKRDGLKKDE